MAELRGYVVEHFLGVLPVVRYIAKRERYYRRLRAAPPSATILSPLSTLKRDGVVVMRNFIDDLDNYPDAGCHAFTGLVRGVT